MGGFEGGDEGGFWEEETVYTPKNSVKVKRKLESHLRIDDSMYIIRAFAKVDITLDAKDKLCVKQLENVYDTISFIPSNCKTFTIEGCDFIALESNSIYKAYRALVEATGDSDIEAFFTEYKVVVDKKIPKSSGGASSNAAAFIRLVKEACNLVLSTEELVDIGTPLGFYVPFFLHNYPMANISKCGTDVKYYEEG